MSERTIRETSIGSADSRLSFMEHRQGRSFDAKIRRVPLVLGDAKLSKRIDIDAQRKCERKLPVNAQPSLIPRYSRRSNAQ